jgi:hypothetical protein
MEDALRLAPLLPDVEAIPNLSITTFDEVEAVRVAMSDQLHRELAQDTAAVAADETEQRSLGLEKPRAAAILGWQVEEQMAVHDVGVGLALAAPHTRKSTRNTPPKQPFVESFTDFGEKSAIGIIESIRARPVDRRVGNQGKSDGSRKIYCLDEVIGLC